MTELAHPERAALDRAFATLAPARSPRAAIEPWLKALRARGADASVHSRRSFLHHLVGTWRILTLWGQSEALCRAGLFHSVYGTQYFEASHFQSSERVAVRALIGFEAERLAHLFCAMDRRELPALARAAESLESHAVVVARRRIDGRPLRIRAHQLGQLLALEAANVAEQQAGARGQPCLWLGQVTALLTGATRGLRLPDLIVECAANPPRRHAEARAVTSYEAAVQVDDGARAEVAARETSTDNPWVAEPHLAVAAAALERGDGATARAGCDRALARLLAWGTAWDKRLPWQVWLASTLRLRASARESAGDARGAEADTAMANRFHALAAVL